MKRITKVLISLLIISVCVMAFTACMNDDNKGATAPLEVNCIVDEWSQETTINSKGTTFYVTLSQAAPIYWKSSKDASLYTYTLRNEAGDAIERDVYSTGDLPAGKYSLQIIPKDILELKLKVIYYNSQNSIEAENYTFGLQTSYSVSNEIPPSGRWYKFTLDEEKFVLLK